jgi:hypothetical protein
MAQVFGTFIERDNNLEFLVINFSPGSVSLQQRWRNNGLSADFLGDYWATFFPTDGTTTSNKQDEVKSAVSYIANELLENAMKFSHEGGHYPISIGLHLYENELRFYVSNCVTLQQTEQFQAFIQELLHSDPDELYMDRLEHSAEHESSSSHLGFLTMINDYRANLAWKFEPHPQDMTVMIVTTMVQLSV